MPNNPSSKDPVHFAESVFNIRLWDTQKEILRAIERERRLAVKACHASGKTFVAAIAALRFAAKHRNSRVLIIAPGWLTVRSVLWSEIHSLLARARLRMPTTVLNQTEIRLGVDNLVLGVSTNDASRLQGHHAEHLLIICDEAPGIEPSFWPAVEGILAGGDTHLLALGNPTVSSGYFYDAFTRNRQAWTTFSISAFDTPNLAGLVLDALLAQPDGALDDNPCPYLTTRRWVRERYAEWFNGSPENSPLWQSRVLGEFPSSSSNALIPLTALEHARRAPVDNGADIIIGVDPAGPGRDKTAAVACAGGAIVDSKTWTEPDARGPVLAWLRRWQSRIRLVRYDSCGLGYFFAEPLRDAGYRCEGINVAAASKDRERYANAKAERFWNLRDRFIAGDVSGLSDEMLAELAAITWLLDTHGRIAIEGKADVKAALGHSPDLAESLMLALGEGAPQPFEYTAAPAMRSPMDYGHTRQPADGLAGRCYEHPWRDACGPCSIANEDAQNARSGRLTFPKGSW